MLAPYLHGGAACSTGSRWPFPFLVQPVPHPSHHLECELALSPVLAQVQPSAGVLQACSLSPLLRARSVPLTLLQRPMGDRAHVSLGIVETAPSDPHLSLSGALRAALTVAAAPAPPWPQHSSDSHAAGSPPPAAPRRAAHVRPQAPESLLTAGTRWPWAPGEPLGRGWWPRHLGGNTCGHK